MVRTSLVLIKIYASVVQRSYVYIGLFVVLLVLGIGTIEVVVCFSISVFKNGNLVLMSVLSVELSVRCSQVFMSLLSDCVLLISTMPSRLLRI